MNEIHGGSVIFFHIDNIYSFFSFVWRLFHFPAENRVSNLSYNLRYIYYYLKIEDESFMIIVD